MKNFKDKIAYIIGGSSGIGLAIAKLLAAKGAHILILARHQDRLVTAVEDIAGQCLSKQQRVAWRQMDVSLRAEVEEVLGAGIRDFGIPKLLINCAGRSYPRYFETIPYAQLDETMKINFYGIWNTTSILAPYMKEQGGYIVNVSSMAGFIGVFGFTDYSASKFAVIGFSEALRSELRPHGVTVSVLCPPDTDTPAFEIENRTKPEETKAISESAGLMQPEAVAAALLKGMRRKRFMIIPGLEGKFTFWMKRLFPWLVDAVMDWQIRRIASYDSRGPTNATFRR